MFNNAGISVWGEMRDMTLDHWQRIMDVNLWGVIYGTMSAYRVMVEQGFGHIVNTASSAGLAPSPFATAYVTTKHGVVGLSTSLRAEGAGLGVKVSVVCPGLIRTGISDAAEFVTRLEGGTREFVAAAISKMMEPDDCARVILRGVERNKAIITVTGLARVLWWLNRLSPDLMLRLLLKMVSDVRAMRVES
jgi:short-subunit dehydrogenase